MRSRKREALAIAIGLVFFACYVALVWPRTGAENRAAATTAPIDRCDTSEAAFHEATTDFDKKSYRATYYAAQKGLRFVSACSDKSTRLPIRGDLLTLKAVAEHYLPNEMGGSAETDINQASMLLEQCETDPDLYATQAAAECETAQEGIAKLKTAWDFNELSP